MKNENDPATTRGVARISVGRSPTNCKQFGPKNNLNENEQIMDRITDETDWRAIYQRYVQLERLWHVDEASEPIARQFFRRIVHGHQSESAILREFRSFRLEPPPPDLLREAFYLQSMLYPSDCKRPGGRHPDDPFENVYAAALSMLPHGFWEESPELTQLYRGQRDVSWPTTPKLFRNEDVAKAHLSS